MIDRTCGQRWKGSNADFKGEVGAADFSPCGFQLILWWKFFQVIRDLTFFFLFSVSIARERPLCTAPGPLFIDG